MLIVVSESNKAIATVQGCFVYAAHSPLPRTFKTAANALTARNVKRPIGISIRRTKNDRPFASLRVDVFCIPSLEGVIAGHNIP